MFSAAIERDSVSILKLLFHSHVQVILHLISPIFNLKYPYSCFSSHFWFLAFIVFLFSFNLPFLFLVAVNSLSLLSLIYSSSSWIVACMQLSLLLLLLSLLLFVCYVSLSISPFYHLQIKFFLIFHPIVLKILFLIIISEIFEFNLKVSSYYFCFWSYWTICTKNILLSEQKNPIGLLSWFLKFVQRVNLQFEEKYF